MENSIDKTLKLLEQEFPNLKWKPHHLNKDTAHAFTSKFCGWWEVNIEVFPVGSVGFIKGGNSMIVYTPNEEGKTLEQVVSQLREDWDKIAYYLSKTKQG